VKSIPQKCIGGRLVGSCLSEILSLVPRNILFQEVLAFESLKFGTSRVRRIPLPPLLYAPPSVSKTPRGQRWRRGSDIMCHTKHEAQFSPQDGPYNVDGGSGIWACTQFGP